ncbi:AraC family transcriptional regulator [Oxalobacter sp. OttesenSCG-928-P03]|nr:AraC family transcriptional regulator [Oxalobacter sp. OttesenSCG-928-P03]
MPENIHADLAAKNEQIKENILYFLPDAEDYPTGIEGFTFHRRHETARSECSIVEPAVGVIIQGSKVAVMGLEECRYRKLNYLVAGIDMPSMGYISSASEEEPFLGISLKLDRQLITQLSSEIPSSPRQLNDSRKSMAVADMDAALLDAFLRLSELPKTPEQIPVLSPMIVREIHYRLLTGPTGPSLRMLNTLGSHSNQIAGAITWLRENYTRPLSVEGLARMANMSLSTFHRHFKQVTTLSPLQYQKRLRLYEAQRLMLVENEYAATACLAVGYESPTQFNREYKRLFGESPLRDIARARMQLNG